MDEADRKVLHERLKEFGPETVHAMLTSDSFPTGMKMEILKWLADQYVVREGKKG